MAFEPRVSRFSHAPQARASCSANANTYIYSCRAVAARTARSPRYRPVRTARPATSRAGPRRRVAYPILLSRYTIYRTTNLKRVPTRETARNRQRSGVTGPHTLAHWAVGLHSTLQTLPSAAQGGPCVTISEVASAPLAQRGAASTCRHTYPVR